MVGAAGAFQVTVDHLLLLLPLLLLPLLLLASAWCSCWRVLGVCTGLLAVLSCVHNYLLVAPLHAAVPLRQVHQVTKVVTNNLQQHSTAQHSTARNGMARQGTAQRSTVH
jgi:hypothetical protein